MTECKKCGLTDQIKEIQFDDNGVCSFCGQISQFEALYPQGKKGERMLSRLVKEMKLKGKTNRYDCIVGVSGGCDSSYLLAKTVELGLRPLTVHWNNNWNTLIAENNLHKLVQGLHVDFFEYTVDQAEYDDICRSFLYASVPDADIANDIALTSVLYFACEKFGVPYILNAHSFRTEGFAPLSWSYMDGKYVQNVQMRYGRLALKTFPNLLLKKWLYWMTECNIQRFRPLYYMDYRKPEAMRFLQKRFSWQWYGGHHAENKYTKFIGNWLHPRKFHIDLRIIEYAALVRSGHISLKEAKETLEEPVSCEPEILDEVKSRLDMTDQDLKDILGMPVRNHFDFETYQKEFHVRKEQFRVLFEQGKIPATFFIKYVEDA